LKHTKDKTKEGKGIENINKKKLTHVWPGQLGTHILMQILSFEGAQLAPRAPRRRWFLFLGGPAASPASAAAATGRR